MSLERDLSPSFLPVSGTEGRLESIQELVAQRIGAVLVRLIYTTLYIPQPDGAILRA